MCWHSVPQMYVMLQTRPDAIVYHHSTPTQVLHSCSLGAMLKSTQRASLQI